MRPSGISDRKFFLKTMRSLFPAVLLLVLTSCAAVKPVPQDVPVQAVTAEENETLASQFSPIFLIEHPEKSYNRIGTPRAEVTEKKEENVYVDPDQPAIYHETRKFATPRAAYTNLIYRVHFEQVPFEIFPFYLGAGDNVGLFVIVTLNAENNPLLYTLVHTCGCYLAFIPTSHLPDKAFPEAWNRKRQDVYSEDLPGFLDLPAPLDDNLGIALTIRHATHRVKEVRLVRADQLGALPKVTARLTPLSSLESLSLKNGETTSFYETTGPRTGYVKASQKIWERLFMSWWALDWRVGEDKKLGQNRNDGLMFYTSLVPWQKSASDLREFDTFLKFWGWNF